MGPSASEFCFPQLDQTPVPFTFNAKKTLESVGQRTVHIRKSTCDTKMVSCAMTVSASGRVLTPLFVFKGAPNGQLERNEFITYPGDIEYTCQGNAWMDERVMHLWMDRILKTYIDQAPPGIVPLHLLDSYSCHMMKSTVNAIEDLGVEVEHIPGGCTSLCQSVDVGVNKPFKSRIRKLWEEWMISTGLHKGKVTPPNQKTHHRMVLEFESGLTSTDGEECMATWNVQLLSSSSCAGGGRTRSRHRRCQRCRKQ